MATVARSLPGGQQLLHTEPIVLQRQKHAWDCGLACCVMVIRSLSVHSVSVRDVYAQCGTKSIWTVDLAHLLRRSGCSVLFATLTVGANPAFSSEYFYKGQIAADRGRVERLFREADDAGIGMHIGSLSWQELRDYVSQESCLAIVLVDKWKLREGAKCCCGLVDPGYAGHYIVVSAYREDPGMFVIHDPACSAPSKLMSAACLDQARQSFGTDEDVLIVSRQRPAESHDSEYDSAGASAQDALWHYS